ncbi:hypothetical protein GCM10027403_35540 [Arthrobacter tecti]
MGSAYACPERARQLDDGVLVRRGDLVDEGIRVAVLDAAHRIPQMLLWIVLAAYVVGHPWHSEGNFPMVG